MHTIDLLAVALAEARRLGYVIRQDWLGGEGGAACEIRGRKTLFLDLAQTPEEQLEVVRNALAEQGEAALAQMPPKLVERLQLRRAA